MPGTTADNKQICIQVKRTFWLKLRMYAANKGKSISELLAEQLQSFFKTVDKDISDDHIQ